MSDFTTCDFGAITPELLIRSLLSGITGIEACGIRMKMYDIVDVATPVYQCTTPTDFMELFRKALVIADDGKVAIRVLRTQSLDGAGLSTCQNCVDSFTVYEFLGSLFIADSTGAVYLNLIQITT